MVHLLNREREKIIPFQQNEVLLPTATLMFTSIDARRSLRKIEISRKITSGEQRVDTTMECSKLEKVLCAMVWSLPERDTQRRTPRREKAVKQLLQPRRNLHVDMLEPIAHTFYLLVRNYIEKQEKEAKQKRRAEKQEKKDKEAK